MNFFRNKCKKESGENKIFSQNKHKAVLDKRREQAFKRDAIKCIVRCKPYELGGYVNMYVGMFE